MTEEQKKLKEHFLEPETRDGYFIDAKMKAAWKEMLNILEEVVRICNKYNLNYTLAGGTLLGAVRHKGFIPWDDDIDIDMPREDYDRLIKILERDTELRSPYLLQTFYTDFGRTSTFAQIRNPNTTAIDPSWVKFKDCFNMGIGIDIFPIDGIPETMWSRVVTNVFVRFASGVMLRYKKPLSRAGISLRLKYLFSRIVCSLFGKKTIWRLREWAFARNSMRKCRQCGEFSFRMSSKSERWSPEVYKSYLTVPFEYLDLKIPVGYDQVLTSKYGDWRKPAKIDGYHTPLVIDTEKSYKRVLVDQFDYKPEWVESLP